MNIEIVDCTAKLGRLGQFLVCELKKELARRQSREVCFTTDDKLQIKLVLRREILSDEEMKKGTIAVDVPFDLL